MIYDVDLDDGRTVTLEADNPPSEQDIYAALQSYQPPAPRPQLQPGDLAGPEARQIPDLTTTTRGGPPAKLASFAETIQEPLALAPEMVVHEGITLPGLSDTIKKAGEQYIGGLGIRGVSTPTPPEQFTPAQKLASGAIQGVDELVEGVANFLSSSQGITETGAAASPLAPAVYLKWANDMVRGGMLNAGEAYDAYKRGDWETFAKQVTGGLGMLLGAGAVTKHGVGKIAEPIQAFTGGTPRLEEANAKALAATIPPEKVSIDTGGKVNELRLEGMSLRDAMDLVSGKQSPEQVVEKNYQKMVSPAWNANVSQVQGGHGEAMIAGYNLAIERIKNILGEEPITKTGETYASPIRSDTGQILEAGQIPETSENVSGQNLQLAPPGQPEPVVPRVEQRPQAEVLPPVEPPKVEPISETKKPLTGKKLHTRFRELYDNMDVQKQADILGEIGADIDENGRFYSINRDGQREYWTGEALVNAKREFVQRAEASTAPAPPSETAVTTPTPEHLARTTERGLESKIRVSKDRETGQWNVVEDFYEAGTNKKVDAEFLESFDTEEEALRHAATLKKSETVEPLSEPIKLSAEDKADVRMDEPGITRRTTPNVIVIQLRDLESRPIREVQIKPTGDPMTDAQNVVRRIRQEAADDNRISLRESGGNSTDENGMGILHFTDSPNGPAFASVRDLVEARKKTKFTLPESEVEARQLAKKQFAEMKAAEGVKMAPEGVPSPAAKINLSNASVALVKAGLSYVIGQPREQFAKSPKRKIMERYWKALDEYEASKKRTLPPAPPLEPKAKEPWEMTLAETIEKERADYAKHPQNFGLQGGLVEPVIRLPKPEEIDKYIEDWVKPMHRQIVESTVKNPTMERLDADGNPVTTTRFVPPEVLADYPELKGKEKATPQKAAAKIQTEVAKVVKTEGTRSAKDIKEELIQRIETELERLSSDIVFTEEPSRSEGYTNLKSWKIENKDGNTGFVDIEKLPTGKWRANYSTWRGRDYIDATTPEEALKAVRWLHGSGQGKVTIEIPGDGSFDVFEDGKALTALLKKAGKINTQSTGAKRAGQTNYQEVGTKQTDAQKAIAQRIQESNDVDTAIKLYGSAGRAVEILERQLETNRDVLEPKQIFATERVIEMLKERTPAPEVSAKSVYTMKRKEMIDELASYGITETFTGGYVKNSTSGDLQNMLTQARKQRAKQQTSPASGSVGSVGPGAASPGDVPKQAQIEQLTAAFKNINAQKAPLLERIKQAFDFGKQRDLSRDLIGRTLSALKTSGDYLVDTWKGVNDVDPILKVKGQLSSELELRGWRMRQAMKDMKRAVPDIKTREAISKWVDAGGDPEVLRNAAETVPANRRSAYERALQLTPGEKIFAEHIKSYFESRLQEAKDAGVLENGIEDYIHRIYPRETPWRKGVLNAIQNGVLNTRRPGLAMKRVFEFDAEAEKAGLKPVGDFIPRVLDYEASLSKVIASREAVKRFTEIKMPDGRPMLDTAGIGMPIEGAEGVREATLIKPSFKPGEHQIGTDGKPTLNYRKDYQARDYGALKKWKWATKDENGNPIFVQGDVLIHPDAVHRIDALLEPSKIRKYAAARAALAVGSTFKQTMLDFSGFHQVQIAIHGLEHKVNPFNLVKEIDAENPNVRGLLRGGVTLGGEHVTGMAQEGLVGRSLSRQIPGLGPLMQTYHSWLFQDFIPRVKMTMALHALERNRSRFAKDLASGKMTEDALFYQTAKEANAAFGELNYIMLERSKTAQDMARMILLAPDFLEARGRFVGQSLTKSGGEQRMALLLGALALYTTARVMNKAISGEYHNEPENLFSVVHNGKAYSIRTVQGDVLHAIEEPVKFWLHRLNPTMTRPLFELLSGRDEFGRKRNFWQVMGDTVSNAIPISMRHGREQSIWTSLLNAFGGSVRRNSEVRRIYDAAQEWKKANNIRTEPGEFIYDPSQDIYRPLKLAILDGDTGTAMLEYRKLIDSKVVTPKQASEHFSTYARSPFSGSRANETKFYNSLSEDEKKSYEGAKQEKQRILQGFIKAGGMSPKPVQLKPITRQK